MKRFRSYLFLFLLIAALEGVIFYMNHSIDSKAPVLTAESEELKISVKDGTEKLLEGVTAMDEKDGDLTSQIQIEYISDFHSDRTRTVSYVVVDSAMNVAKLKRTVKYKDYRGPRFSLKEDPVYTLFDEVDIISAIRAEDVIDGDISNQIRLVSTVSDGTQSSGTIKYTFAVSSSSGDSEKITISSMRDTISRADWETCPKIYLKEYILYAKRGKELDYMSYIDRIAVPGEEEDYDSLSYDEDDVMCRIEGNPESDDCYYVDYTILSDNGSADVARLTVVVYE